MTVTPRDMANAVRVLAVDTLVRAKDGHPGTPTGGADIATTLFNRHLKFDPLAPRWPDRDRFVQSNGHGSMLLYSLLHLAGYEAISMEQIKNFRVLGSHTPGHPEYEPDHGVEITTGPLGQGIANAVGMAVAERMLNARFGDAIVDHYTYALVGDGCLMEGVAHEVISLAGHLKLGRLIVLYDDNQMTDDGVIGQAISEDYMQRFACAGWHVQECDGHDPDAISAAIEAAKRDDRPSMIRCRTLIGFGVPRIQNDRAAHGGKLFEEDARAIRERLGWTHPPFVIPDDIVAEWRKAGERGAGARAAWQARVDALDPVTRAEFQRLIEGRLPDGWEKALLAYKKAQVEAQPERSNIQTSGEISRVLSHAIPELVGGAPDLEAATQHKRDMKSFTMADAEGGARRATIFATGSEVAVALEAREALQAVGVPTAVISVPCWELFWEQETDYRAAVIGRGTVRVAVEAATRIGWERFVGEDGGIIGMTSFGASGPVAELFEHFGITPARVVAAVKERL
ncbi:MAG: transketolase C-terminal domain-containing protein, partial [candidate division NC10 bacterium]